MEITNDRDYRISWMMLSMLLEREQENDDYTYVRREKIVELKRKMRRYLRQKAEAMPYERRIIKDYGIDGFVSLERLPDDFKDVDEAREFFEQFRTCEYVPSMYDCTGQWFTNWFKVIKRNGGYYAYHSVSVDI